MNVPRSSCRPLPELLRRSFGPVVASSVVWSAIAAAPASVPLAPPGFEVTLVAREPLVRNPCALAFDARGRLFVGQGPQYRNPKPDTPGDTVELLLDTDGDGVFDRARTFARGLNCVQGLAWRANELWIANSPDLTVARDLDGDDEADEYLLLYTDLGNIEHAVHGLNFAPDGKLYLSKGNSKGLNQPGRVAPKAFRELHAQPDPPGAPDLPPPRTFTKDTYRRTYQDPADDWGRMGGILRCEPDGTRLEIVARGFRNPWDIAFDRGFDWLGTDNDQSEGDRIFMPFFGANFGWAHGWSAHWTGEGHLPTVPVSGPVFSGSGTGIMFSDTESFPPAFRGVWFINDFLHRTTYVYRPRWAGALLQPAGGKWEPFLRAGDALFNPVDIEAGPDGALYLTGWGEQLGAEFRDGRQVNAGRVFRVAMPGTPAPPADPQRAQPLARWSVGQLAAEFASPVGARRSDAAEELVRRGAAVRPELARLILGGRPEAQETWALWTLGRLERDNPDVEAWLASHYDRFSPNARRQALRIAGHRIREWRTGAALPAFVVAALDDPEPRIRFAALQAIALARRPEVIDRVSDLAARETDRVTFYAAWYALREIASVAALRDRLRDPRGGVRRAALLALLDLGALDEPAVRALVGDADAATAGLAALGLAKRDGNPLLVIEPPPGDFVDRVRVKITPGLKPATVRYTTDGSEPVLARGGERSNLTFTETTTLKAALFVNGQKVGATATAVYRKRVPEPPPPPVVLTPPAAPLTVAQVVAALPAADPSRGRSVFHAAGCVACHRVDAEGGAFGPELTGLGARGNVERVIRAILAPGAEITEGFALRTFALKDGRAVAGRLLEESQSNVTVIQPDGQTVTLARTDILKQDTMADSAMPAFDRAMAAADLAALVAWLTRPLP
jgi:putative membrane-bound dehydrogenase-like protein